MKKIELYENIKELEFIGVCSDGYVSKIAERLRYVASKKKIHSLMKKHLPDMCKGSGMLAYVIQEKGYNPYRYFIDEDYFDIVHSDIDHVFKIIRY